MKLVTRNIGGYNITYAEDTEESTIDSVMRPLKSASSIKPEMSSWGRLQELRGDLQETKTISATKSAATEGHQISAFGRLHQLRSS